MRKWLPLLFASLVAGRDGGERVDNFTLADAEGRRHSLYDHKDAKAVVLVFLGTECPVSNRYPARLAQLQRDYAPRGVVFLGVNSNAHESAEAVAKHSREMGLRMPVLLDPDQTVADRLRVKTVPCAVVVDASWEVRYRGRIDDHKTEELVKSRYLRDALDSVLAGKAVAVSSTEPVGCRIQRKLEEKKEGPVTFAEHVAPILYNNCTACHRPGQVAPFPLVTYEDARRWGPDLVDAAKTRRMPPWKASNHGMFRGERVLKTEEIALLEKWVRAGSPLGDASQAPPPPKFAEGWMLGEPDLVLTAPEYEVAADGDDEYRVFVMPTGLKEDRWVAAVEVRPGNYNVVHHVLGYVDSSGAARRLDEKDPLPGYAARGTGPLVLPSGEMSGWAPGTQPYASPKGVGRFLPKNSDILLEMHYHKNGRREKDRTSIGLYFAKTPVTERLQWLSLVNWWFKIPAGEKRHTVVAKHTIKNDMKLRSIAPHMHLIGREVYVEAELPDRTKKALIDIRDWDFNWQDVYHFREPVALPKGTKLTATVVYDNSSGNPMNPNHPPRAMKWGEQTTDEMCIVFISYTRDGQTALDEEEWEE